MKNRFKYLIPISLVIALILCISCENQEDYVNEKNHKLTRRFISFDEFKQKANPFDEFQNIQRKIELAKSSRLVYNAQFNIIIDTDKILYMEKDGYRSYTFGIVTNSDDQNTKNLVLSTKDDVDYKAFITEYTLTEEEKEKIVQNEFVDLLNKVTLTKLNWSGGGTTEEGEPCNTVIDHVSIIVDEYTGEFLEFLVTYADPCDPESGSGSGGGGDGGGGDGGGGSGDGGGGGFGGGSWGGWGGWGGWGDGSGSGTGGGGSTGGGSTGGGDSSGGGGVYYGDDPNNPDYSLSESDGNNVITYPVIDDTANIKALNKLTKNNTDGTKTPFKLAIDDLKGRLATDHVEDGYLFNAVGESIPPDENLPTATNWGNYGPNFYITIHMHQNTYYPPGVTTLKPTNPVMSDQDVRATLDKYYTTGNKNTTSILVSRQGTFALRVSKGSHVVAASNALQDSPAALKAFNDEYNNMVMSQIEKNPSDEEAALNAFIDFINTYLINGSPMGISIYQAVYDSEGNITNWIKR